MIFGANYDWKQLGAYTVDNGEIIWDRSFRSKADTVNKDDFWKEIATGGTVTWNTADDGDTAPAGSKSYKGFVELSQGSPGFTGIWQNIMTGLKSDRQYSVYFSSYGVGTGADAEVYLYDSSWTVIDSETVTVSASAWTRHSLTLSPSADVDSAILGIYVTSADTVRIDEVRMFRSGELPRVNESLKTSIRDLGVKSLRWPGGTLVDWFFWKDSIGPNLVRGELQAFKYYETPGLGLHEFLDLCEELNIEPLVQVNVLDTPENAADLVEYILGPETSAQGALRSANGRSSPWNAVYFEMGNEPSENYTGSSLPATGSNYSLLANAVITAMKAKASSLGKTIKLGTISEPGFQLAGWLVPGDNGILDLIYSWNSRVFDSASGVLNADFTNGHFYSSRYYDADAETNFRYAMTGGSLLKQTLEEKIFPLTSLPLWLTEYHIVLENSSNVIQTDYLKDFQSGLAIADILMSAVEMGLPAAHIYNLVDTNGFGIILNPETGTLRPGGLVFRLFSVISGEEILDVKTGSTGVYAITAAHGNVPADFSYPLVSALAVKNSATGRARVFILNRDYSNAASLEIELESFAPGEADLYRYENSDIGADNEGGENVAITAESVYIDAPFTVAVPAHSLWRIDFR